MAEFSFQNLNETDLPGVLACIHAASRADHVPNFPNVADLKARFDNPLLNRETDLWVARAPNTGVVGYAEGFLRPGEKNLIYITNCTIHPDFRSRGIGGAFLKKQWQRVQDISAEQGDKAVTLAARTRTNQPLAIALFQDFGLKPVRYFFEMVKRLAEDTPPAAIPAGLEIQSWAEKREDQQVWKGLNEAFLDHWGYVAEPYAAFVERIRTGRIQPENSFLVWDGSELAGGCLNEMGEYAVESMHRNEGRIEMLFVRRPWRKQGIGKALVVQALYRGIELGHTQIGLNVDAENLTGAVRLYEDMGFRVSSTVVIFHRQWRGKPE